MLASKMLILNMLGREWTYYKQGLVVDDRCQSRRLQHKDIILYSSFILISIQHKNVIKNNIFSL